MIACAYTTHLYCEVCGRFGEYIGKSRTQTFKMAKKDGWSISNDIERAYCPNHKRRKKNESRRFK